METRRVCYIEVSSVIAEKLRNSEIKLPDGVHVTCTREEVDRDCIVMRLEGDGLPQWAQRPCEGMRFLRGQLVERQGGTITVEMG